MFWTSGSTWLNLLQAAAILALAAVDLGLVAILLYGLARAGRLPGRLTDRQQGWFVRILIIAATLAAAAFWLLGG